MFPGQLLSAVNDKIIDNTLSEYTVFLLARKHRDLLVFFIIIYIYNLMIPKGVFGHRRPGNLKVGERSHGLDDASWSSFKLYMAFHNFRKNSF